MDISDAPGKLVLPFAASGGKNTIPVASQIGITAGAASLTDGFPPLTRTPLAAGGTPPKGLDANGILFEISAITRWSNAGAGYKFDSAFVADVNVNGYPQGSRILRSDGLGYWLNTAANNTTDPEAVGSAAAGWIPDTTAGGSAITMTGSNVTLTALQYGKKIIIISGLLTGNLNLIFPTIAASWIVINNCTGAFNVTCKTAAGSGIVVTPTMAKIICGDGTNIINPVTEIETAAQFTNNTKIASTAFALAMGLRTNFLNVGAGTTTLTSANAGQTVGNGSSDVSAINLPAVSTVPAGNMIAFFCNSTGSLSVARNGSDGIFVNSSAVTSLALGNGDNVVLMSNGSNAWVAVSGTVQMAYALNAPFCSGQSYHNVTGSRTLGVTYTNTNKRPMFVVVSISNISASAVISATVDGNNIQGGVDPAANAYQALSFIVPPGGQYSCTMNGTPTLSYWTELY